MWRLALSLGLFAASSWAQEETCTCVPYYQCDGETGRIITSGQGLLDPRILDERTIDSSKQKRQTSEIKYNTNVTCEEVLDVCCWPPLDTTSSPGGDGSGGPSGGETGTSPGSPEGGSEATAPAGGDTVPSGGSTGETGSSGLEPPEPLPVPWFPSRVTGQEPTIGSSSGAGEGPLPSGTGEGTLPSAPSGGEWGVPETLFPSGGSGGTFPTGPSESGWGSPETTGPSGTAGCLPSGPSGWGEAEFIRTSCGSSGGTEPSASSGADAQLIPLPMKPEGKGCGFKRSVPYVPERQTPSNSPELTITPSGFGEYPWTVVVYTKENGANKFICVGSLIKPSVVLTAAHCLDETKELKVRAGEWDVESEDEPVTHQDRSVKRQVAHPSFRGQMNHDIAILVLDTPFELNLAVDTICLPSPQFQLPRNVNCTATGWGQDQYGEKGKYQRVMKQVELPLVTHRDCQKKLRETKLGPTYRLHGGYICAGGDAGQDTCTGDGGAPLVCPVGEGRYVQVGIASWGVGCGNSIPTAYSNMVYYYPWVFSTLHRFNHHYGSPTEGFHKFPFPGHHQYPNPTGGVGPASTGPHHHYNHHSHSYHQPYHNFHHSHPHHHERGTHVK